jgi:hypothetical protein
LASDLWRFPAIRRSFEAAVGRVFRRFFGLTSASRIKATSRFRASSRF